MNFEIAFQPGKIRENLPYLAAGTHKDSVNSRDFQLWHRFQSGSESAYETIYRNNATALYGFGLKLTHNKELVEDCIQDLFLEIWQRKHRLAAVKSIKSYLFKAYRRKLIAESVKKRSIFSEKPGANTTLFLKDTSFEKHWILTQQIDEQKKKLQTAINRLTTRQQEIIQLKFYALLNYSEIAEVMDLSIKGAYKLMGRSIAQLRNFMNIKP